MRLNLSSLNLIPLYTNHLSFPKHYRLHFFFICLLPVFFTLFLECRSFTLNFHVIRLEIITLFLSFKKLSKMQLVHDTLSRYYRRALRVNAADCDRAWCRAYCEAGWFWFFSAGDIQWGSGGEEGVQQSADPQEPDCFPAGAGVEEYAEESGVFKIIFFRDTSKV